jgi:nitrate reductase delta subunit
MSVARCPLSAGGELLRVAELLRYPDEALARAADDGPDVSAFFDEIESVSLEGMEELYTRTFDLNPVATLEVGWHLWGEQYERGRFLAELRALQDDLGVEEGSELPDHLTVVLATISRLEEPESLCQRIAPALAKIATPLEEHGNPYRHLIRAAAALATGNGQRATAAGGRSSC